MPTQTQATWKNDVQIGSDASIAAVSVARVWRGYILCAYKDNKKGSQNVWTNLFDPYTHQKWFGPQEIAVDPKSSAWSVMPPAVGYLNLNAILIVSQGSSLGYYTIPYPVDADSPDDFKKALVATFNPIAITDADTATRPALVTFSDRLMLLYRNASGHINMAAAAGASGNQLNWQKPVATTLTNVTQGPSVTVLNNSLFCAINQKSLTYVGKSADGINWVPVLEIPGASSVLGPPTGAKLIVLWAATDKSLHTIESTDGVVWTNAQAFPGKTQGAPTLIGSAAGIMLAVYRASDSDSLFYSFTEPDVFNVLPLAPPPTSATSEQGTGAIAATPSLPSRLNANQKLLPGGKLGSPDGSYIFTFQTDGNIVLYNNGNAIWAANTNAPDLDYLIMQDDGNLVLYDKKQKAKWATKTDKHKGAYLAVQDDGNAVVLSSDEKPLWATNTGST
jgi:hypothetical protein